MDAILRTARPGRARLERGLAVLFPALILVLFAFPAMADVNRTIEILAGFGDRSTGSEGCARTADLIEREFKAAVKGEEAIIGRQSFRTPTRRRLKSSLVVDGVSHPVHPFFGNALSTGSIPEPGMTGRLIYAGPGDLASFNHKKPQGAVVLMDMDSGKNWVNAAVLGAGGLIYLDDDKDPRAPRGLFQDKFELNPTDFPRFWMTRTQARELFGDYEKFDGSSASPEVRLVAQTIWENSPADNIYCLIPGTNQDFEDDLLIVQGFYDSTVFTPGLSPGADEAASASALLALAREFGRVPPARPVLLLASAGHAQGLAGMREFIWAVNSRRKDLRQAQKDLKKLITRTKQTLEILGSDDPLGTVGQGAADSDEGGDLGARQEKLLVDALMSRIKSRVDGLSNELISLRLAGEDKNKELIRKLVDERMVYKRLSWRSDFRALEPGPKNALMSLLPEAAAEQKSILADARAELKNVSSSYQARKLASGKRITAVVSLRLSSRGDGVGSFSQGFLFNLRPRINKIRLYPEIDDILKKTAARLKTQGLDLYRDTLRPSRKTPWRSYLPDRPSFGGELAALAGLPGLALCTTHDARVFWGTPYDTLDRVNWEFLEKQEKTVVGLIRGLAREEQPETGYDARRGYAALIGRANFLRQGELFPDQPAAGALIQAYQGSNYFMAMVDSMGRFRLAGLADSKHVTDKAIIEAFRFDPDTGRAVWAVDKKLTGKPSYRVKMRRHRMETDLIMFNCGQVTLYNLLEPRTFRYLSKVELLDAKTDAKPLRYWYSRLDTWSSSLTSIFLDPDLRFKLTLSDNMLSRKLLLLNGTAKDPKGDGYPMSGIKGVKSTEYLAARDMWTLLGPRIMNLEKHGVVNDRIRGMKEGGIARLKKAEEFLAKHEFDRFIEESRASWSLAARVYNDIDKTQKDVLFGVLFYVALFIPFAYCLERLLFSFIDIKKRIIAFLAILALVITLIYFIHPAFNLTYSPMVVILAFFILGLSVLVSLIIFFRFEQEMVNLQRRSMHLKQSNISRFRAFAAAFVIGVTNLRRRRLRTILTCVTLIILTFTIMNFTAVKSSREYGRLMFSRETPYHGVMMRTMGWLDLPVEALSCAETAFGRIGPAAPRVWYENKDKTRPVIVPVRGKGGLARAGGVSGLSFKEPEISGLDRILVSGRWFRPGERFVVLLPDSLAKRIGASPDDPEKNRVEIWGVDFKVVGTFAGDRLDKAVDLDGEPLTPVTYPSETDAMLTDVEAEAIESGDMVASYQGRYVHVEGGRTIIMPDQTLLTLGGNLKGVAARPASGRPSESLTRELTDRFGLMLFSCSDQGTSVSYAADSLSYSGVPNIIVPLLIAMLIVLNTMIGSVYERKREIGVYTSVGLAPSHVSFLFIAESLAFAVLSVVVGYLLAQTVAALFAGTGLWRGMTANYSSLAGVAAMLLVILVVLVSVIYPSKVAADIAIPDVNRSWVMPEVFGDEMVVSLPFLVKFNEQECVGGFLMDYYSAHRDVSHGLFSTDDLDFSFACPLPRLEGALEKTDCFTMRFKLWMSPFDFGVRQQAQLTMCATKAYPGYMEVQVRLRREAGEGLIWRRLNKSFLNDLRKQLLIWRSLDEEARLAYENLLRERLSRKKLKETA